MENVIEELTKKIIQFRDNRDWKQFHNPKDLAISLGIEAGELLECFQWKTNEEIKELLQSEKKIKVQEEIADVAMYLLFLCNETNINLEEAILDKIKKNEEKYPVSKSKGNAKKYNEL
ncbi:nucleotide pyrophosphohydrolase [Clostridium ganghwense]|uniref:Nucleotide pyrophosphohydrolase n=1 Tax=Clostridium ganghwense TaxID=312089 RepID=A0ABT4CTS3_9CLOT|nr:nucleotide pyrophosphohydrolase [Clostridium ganghwense]MCY6372442.1 nucleotide pyrophosphohydrolase [Clostridium ganghwense]